MAISINLNSNFGKFAKGFVTSGSAALSTFLLANGCQVTSLKEFGIAAGAAVAGGLFHMIFNMIFTQPLPPAI